MRARDSYDKEPQEKLPKVEIIIPWWWWLILAFVIGSILAP